MARVHEEATTCSPVEQNDKAVLIVLVIGTFLAPLDSSIVNIALPEIATQFGERLSAVGWVTSAYLLTTAALLLSMGRLGDVWGLRRLYVFGLLGFGLGSLACAFSSSLNMLIASRVVQAVGASMLFAAGPALVVRTFPPNRRGWALGYISLAVSAGLTVGPALGGFLVGTFGWPSIFLINVPLTVVVAAVAWRMLEDECPQGEAFDLLGALLAGSALAMLLLGLGQVEVVGPLGAAVWGRLALSAVLAAAFVLWEKRAPSPMVDLRLFHSHSFSAGIAAATLAYMALFSVTFTMPFYLLKVLGLDARVAGLLLTTTPLAMAALAPVAGRMSDRRGSRKLATVGVSILAVGLVLMSLLGPDSAPLMVIPGLLVVGSGMALFQTPNTAAVMRATPRSHAGVGSAFIAEARNVGMSIGVALTAAIVGGAVGGSGLPNTAGPVADTIAEQFSHGMSAALVAGAVVAAVGALLSWFGREPDAVEAEQSKP